MNNPPGKAKSEIIKSIKFANTIQLFFLFLKKSQFKLKSLLILISTIHRIYTVYAVKTYIQHICYDKVAILYKITINYRFKG